MQNIDENAIPVPHYQLVNTITVQPGQRDSFIAILENGTRDMPGNYAYIIRSDDDNPDKIWVTEYWDSEASHKASLSLPAVQTALQKGRPMIVDMKNLSVEQGLKPD